MIDFRIETFLTLCKTKSFTKTAEMMNLTQPAVTQQIHYLENQYHVKLFYYHGKTLNLTEKGELFLSLARSMYHNEKNIYSLMTADVNNPIKLNIGATKTIGEYIISDKIKTYLQEDNTSISMIVENTSELLNKLDNGDIDIALIEGKFDKKKYEYQLIWNEPFIGVCSSSHPFASKTVPLPDLFDNTIILREQGSGTRDIFENLLSQFSFDSSFFKRSIEISSFSVLSKLVRDNVGISFVYQAVATGENLDTFQIKNISLTRELNYVYLRNSINEDMINHFINI